MDRTFRSNESERVRAVGKSGDERSAIGSTTNVRNPATSASIDQRHGHPRMTLYLTMIAAVAALGGLLFGFDTGVIGGAMLFIVLQMLSHASKLKGVRAERWPSPSYNRECPRIVIKPILLLKAPKC